MVASSFSLSVAVILVLTFVRTNLVPLLASDDHGNFWNMFSQILLTSFYWNPLKCTISFINFWFTMFGEISSAYLSNRYFTSIELL